MRYLYFSFFILLFSFTIAHADEITDLKQKISDRNVTIQSLEKEIQQYQIQVEKTGKEANTLQNTINSLDLSKKKLETEVKLTQNRISNQNLEIDRLKIDIGNKGERILHSKRVIAEIMKKVYASDSQSLPETFVGYQSLSSFWDSIDQLVTLQDSTRDRIAELVKIKTNLEENKKLIEKKREELVVLKEDLVDQGVALSETAKEKAALLKETKNTEANYKAIIANKVAQKAQFEKELFEFESALKIAIDPASIPRSGSGVLKYPLDKVIITQYFGNTAFATQNAQIYNGKGHTGMDFGTPVGTPIKASASGIVTGVGNTDLVKTCYSYGKWIFIKHPNGLSTLYAHLSNQLVRDGQTVTAGQTIGYSGNTGYSTGPHLHFGVYATQGVRVTTFDNSINCKGVLIPLADPKAYLNPLSYL
jgi:murein DD-endopeptidase MepM/ murein hydrolase activator NlpD